MESSSDTGYAPTSWVFDAEVTRVFEDMIARSIPDYDGMRRCVFEVGSRFVRDGGLIVDLGCSRGQSLQMFVDEFGSRTQYVGVDNSSHMVEAARSRFPTLVANEVMTVFECDLREDYPARLADLTLSVLTAQFVPIELRQQLFRWVYEHTSRRGAFILVEKVLGSRHETQQLLVDLYHERKIANGYTREQVEAKRLALQGQLVPVTSRMNERMLLDAGFGSVEGIWRHLNFAAWVAIRND